MHKSLLLSTACLACLLSAASASASSNPWDGDVVVTTTPELVVVSATRTEQRPSVTGASITVIDAKDIETQQTVVLTDILKEVPSVMVNRTGGVGQTTTVSIRGAEQGQTVTLIDGMRINDPSDVSGGAVYGDVLANNIARVEILRGPQSTLYGSDAIGGVVDIITKRGGDGPFALTATAEGGSFGTFHANAAANGTEGAFEYGAALNFFTNTGISMADSRNGNHENDGTTQVGADLNTSWNVSDTISVDLRGYYSHGHTDFDDNFPFVPPFAVQDSGASNTDELKAGYLGVNADLFGGTFHNRLALIATEQGRTYFNSATDPGVKNYEYFGGTARLEYQGVVDIDPDSQVTFGAETQESTFRNNNFGAFAFFSPPTIGGHDRLTGYYLQAQTTLFEQLTLTGGVRLDDDDEFGTHTSYKFNAAWNIPDWDATLRGNIGSGFKAPSLFQEFGPNSNPLTALKPESATGWEVGFDKSFWDNQVHASATYFERHTSNQIDFVNCFSPLDAPGCPTRVAVFGYYDNLDKTRATGVELQLDADVFDTLNVALNYTNMSARNVLAATDLARRPHDLANAVLTWKPWDGTVLGASLTYQGKRFNDNGNFTPLTSNTTVNLFGSYDLTRQWQLYGRIDNLFNDRTQQVTDYGVPGIGAYGGVRVTL
jgi:vitamin B12 transporter